MGRVPPPDPVPVAPRVVKLSETVYVRPETVDAVYVENTGPSTARVVIVLADGRVIPLLGQPGKDAVDDAAYCVNALGFEVTESSDDA